jgi:hypothetical protein
MTATPSQIKDALKTALQTIPGLRAYDYQPDGVNPPFAFSTLDEITYHGAMGAGNIVNRFTVTVVVQRVSERTAQDKLDGYVAYSGAQSVRAALEADRTLGGVVQDLIVTGATNITNIDANDTLYLTVDFQLLVYA